jgi:hypothetical protein
LPQTPQLGAPFLPLVQRLAGCQAFEFPEEFANPCVESDRPMPITTVQQGAIGQFIAAILMMMGSNGKLEVAVPMSDDDRRDQEVHARGVFGKALALQIKTTLRLHVRPDRLTPQLFKPFIVDAERLVSHPLFWYLFAYLDRKTMTFADPIFLVDSATVHAHAAPRLRDGVWRFAFHASMGPRAHDRWVPYRVHPEKLGSRVLQILQGRLKASTLELASEPALQASDILWIGRHAGRIWTPKTHQQQTHISQKTA